MATKLLRIDDRQRRARLGRRHHLGEHGPDLFDRNGNAGPTVWADGRIVGGWTQRRSGEVVHRLLEDTGAETAAAVAEAAAELAAWLGGAHHAPFPHPAAEAVGALRES